jgi:glutamyl-tRNA synthetase
MTVAETNNEKVRTRFAPSPTGFLHIGSLRTALFSYLYAKNRDGDFILRVEDTDQARFVEGSIAHLVEVLKKMGLEYNEGIFIENGKITSQGPFGPYLQSERKMIYQEYAKKLIESKHAYYCFCDEKRLEELRKEQEALKKPTQYDRKCKNLSEEEIQANLKKGLKPVVRQAIPETGQTIVKDLVYKDIVYENKVLDDQILLKSDGFPTYHLAVVVDDHLMQISHVIRGEEWIPSTPKHLLLYKDFNWDPPKFAHLPLLLNKYRTKLSKRQGDVSVEDFLNKGYLKEAIINFVAFLGWNPKTDQEIFTINELIAEFDFSKVNKSGAIFDVEKLDWINSLYIRQINPEKLADLVVPYLLASGIIKAEASDKSGNKFLTNQNKILEKSFIVEILKLEQGRLKKLSEIGERTRYFFEQPSYSPEILIWHKSNIKQIRENLEKVLEYLKSLPENDFQDIKTIETKLKEFIWSNNLDNGSVLWPLRVALSGMEASPSPFEIMLVLFKGYGHTEILQRVEKAIAALQ